ncbi:MAG: glycosyltransferase family 2 protein [Candidatus Portnoybacteria bacterium]|nr:glycosyltransferase family 2 protein [Candidatus Portnoybacteria bacterium]
MEQCLNMVFRQKAGFAFEVICVDSGSKDKTLEIVEKFRDLCNKKNDLLSSSDEEGVGGGVDEIITTPLRPSGTSPQLRGGGIGSIKLFQIPPLEFGHGRTRNFAVSKTSGEYLVFLTQDAIPADENWLKNIIKPMEDDSEVAGVFGQHLPRKECDPFQRKTLNEFMDSFGKELTIYKLANSGDEKEFEAKKHVLSFFSNVNSAIRRSVFEKIPFRDIEMGEDQFWAKDILLAGYKKAYAPEAKVYHSHNYGIWNQFKRWFDEFRQHKKNINYVGVSSIWKILPLALRLWLNDVRYIKNQKEYNFGQKIYWVAWIFFMDLARMCGEYLGGRYDKLPKWLQNKLSMQYELIHKR